MPIISRGVQFVNYEKLGREYIAVEVGAGCGGRDCSAEMILFISPGALVTAADWIVLRRSCGIERFIENVNRALVDGGLADFSIVVCRYQDHR